ncbi:MAG: PrgI family protein [bacterium]|nr:PrgI family protein [bacterium]
MFQTKIPRDIKNEPYKILGLNFKDFVIVIITAFIDILFISVLPTPTLIKIITATISLILILLLVVIKIEGKSLVEVWFLKLKFKLQPKILIYKKQRKR